MAKIPDYENHLAAAVLNDGKIISYRLLSRELKVHSNAAKRMLFEFHRKQNAKKSGSVHATYLLDGIPKPITSVEQTNGHPQDGDDVPMQSSPFVSSAVQEAEKEEEYAAPSRSILLAREEDLEGAKLQLETIHSIHVYSLQPNTLQNLQALSDCTRLISATFNSEDPLIVGPQYGVIHNNGVRRRTARRPPPGVAPSIASVQKMAKDGPVKPSEDTKTGSNPPTQTSTTKFENPPSSKPVTKPPSLKKEHSDIFKSFSKSKSSLKKEASDTSTLNSPAPHSQESSRAKEDAEPTRDDNDDDKDEEDTYVPEQNKADPQARTARSQRADQLRKMMDDNEDDDENDSKDSKEEEEEDEEMPDADNEPPSTDPPPAQSTTPTPPPTTSNGRRRGRRKVMKKKTVKDDEGYLVTKEEAAWESFSEEEQPARALVGSSSTSSAAGAKGVKKVGGSSAGGGGKVGQGNIMSFFGKK